MHPLFSSCILITKSRMRYFLVLSSSKMAHSLVTPPSISNSIFFGGSPRYTMAPLTFRSFDDFLTSSSHTFGSRTGETSLITVPPSPSAREIFDPSELSPVIQNEQFSSFTDNVCFPLDCPGIESVNSTNPGFFWCPPGPSSLSCLIISISGSSPLRKNFLLNQLNGYPHS